jgi:hypothetical protein
MSKTYEETLDLMNDFANGTVQINKMSDSDLSNIIVALGKQIPKTPKMNRVDKDTVYYKCPSCKLTTVLHVNCAMNYCKKCGQKLND